jgi:copper chaperone CopZ
VKALEVEGQLRKADGILEVKANPTTGNVLVRYDPARIGQFEVLDALQRLGCLRDHCVARIVFPSHARVSAGLRGAVAESLVRTTVELALQRLVSALI